MKVHSKDKNFIEEWQQEVTDAKSKWKHDAKNTTTKSRCKVNEQNDQYFIMDTQQT